MVFGGDPVPVNAFLEVLGGVVGVVLVGFVGWRARWFGGRGKMGRGRLEEEAERGREQGMPEGNGEVREH